MNFGRFASFLMLVGTALLIWGYLLFSSVNGSNFAAKVWYPTEDVQAQQLRHERAYLGQNTTLGWEQQMRLDEARGERRANGKYMLIAGGSLLVLGFGIFMSISKPEAEPQRDASEEAKG